MSGSKILINSFQSNNILIKYDIFYNTALYPDLYLNTNVLDLAFPDITPPTIIFKNNDISLNESQLTPSKIDQVIQMLLDNITYIDIYQDYNSQSNYYNDDICLNNTSYEYINYDSSTNDLCNNIIYDSLITIDLKNITSLQDETEELDIIYTIKDNANNVNIITKGISVNKEFLDPVFYYYDIKIDNFNGLSLIIEEGDPVSLIKEKAKNNLEIIDIEDGDDSFILKDNIIYNDLLEININLSSKEIEYIATSNTGRRESIVFIRNIKINSVIEEEEEIKTHCYPKVYYKPIQHNYKLGSSNTSIMRLSKIIVNNIR